MAQQTKRAASCLFKEGVFMPQLIGVAGAVPEYSVDQVTAREFSRAHFSGRLPRLSQRLQVFDNSGIRRRYFVRPITWFSSAHTLGEVSAIYGEEATRLAARACRKVLQQTQTNPDDISYIIYVNTTGLATPSVDALLINALDLPRETRRTPVWGLGCAGGVAGLSLAFHHALGHPADRVLVVSVELCGLTFLSEDYSQSNFIATALFGDGAAAALVVGDEVVSEGKVMLGTHSWLYPDSLGVMGWHVLADGLQVVFSKRIPTIIRSSAADQLSRLLRNHKVERREVSAYLYHPGGRRVLEAYQHAYGVGEGLFRHSWSVLRDYGNMSSATVFFVLEHLFNGSPTPPGVGVVSSLGPGFSSESILLNT